MDALRKWLTSHNFNADNAEITLFVVLASTVLLYFLFATSNTAKTVTQVLTVDRRSVESYSGPAPMSGIMTALNCAIHAPNHFLTEPWRFRLVGKEGKVTLGELANKFKPGEQFGSVPDFLVVSIAKNSKNKGEFKEWNLNGLEDHAATACAVQNFMVSCASQRIGTKWMTGKMGISGTDMLSKVCKIDAEEHYMGTLLVGLPSVPMSTMKVPNRKSGIGAPVFSTTD
jgi:nitroreductase